MPYEHGFLEWKRLGSIMVVAGAGPIPQGSLERLISDVQRHLVKGIVAIATGRVELTSIQRRLVSTAFRKVPIAAIVEDRLTYGVITAIAWLGTRIKAFPPSDVEGALDYVGVATPDRDWTRRALAEISNRAPADRSDTG